MIIKVITFKSRIKIFLFLETMLTYISLFFKLIFSKFTLFSNKEIKIISYKKELKWKTKQKYKCLHYEILFIL